MNVYEFKMLDRSAVDSLHLRTPAPVKSTPEQLREWLETPYHLRIPWPTGIAPTLGSSNPMGRSWQHTFRLPSPLESGVPENDIVHGDLFCQNREPSGRYAMITLHGATVDDKSSQHYLGRVLMRQGFDVYALEEPYHMRRAQSGSPSGGYFLSPDVLRLVRAVEQGAAEVAALVLGLREQSYKKVFVLGISLGGFIALHAAQKVQMDGVALLTPLIDPWESIWNRITSAAEKRIAAESGFTEELVRQALDAVAPMEQRPPELQPESTAVYLARHDGICPLESTHKWAQRWQLEITDEFECGHMTLGDFYPEIREDLTELFLMQIEEDSEG